MEDRAQFRRRLQTYLQEMDPDTLAYDEEEYPLVRQMFETMEFYAEQNRLMNTALALPLARGLHNGVHRKSKVVRHGAAVRMPYVIHPLTVCRTLRDAEPKLPPEELDILLASALCHDMIEDIPFAEQGRELYTRYHLDPRVYETVKKVTKRKDFTPEEEQAHFKAIREDPMALLVKLSDRGNNVEDLYNMPIRKVHEYADETRQLICPMCVYGRTAYPQLRETIEILEDKITVLVDTAVTLVDRYDARIRELEHRRDALQAENDALRSSFRTLAENEGGQT